MDHEDKEREDHLTAELMFGLISAGTDIRHSNNNTKPRRYWQVLTWTSHTLFVVLCIFAARGIW